MDMGSSWIFPALRAISEHDTRHLSGGSFIQKNWQLTRPTDSEARLEGAYCDSAESRLDERTSSAPVIPKMTASGRKRPALTGQKRALTNT